MPLTDETLSIWKISFRWAGLDPDALRYKFYIPYQAKDNMRLLLNAVIENSLYCISLKPKNLYEPRNNGDQANMVKLHNVITYEKYNRAFLKSHYIDRSDFAHWCNRESIPFPEFWFPPGWAVHELDMQDWILKYNPELADRVKNEKLESQKKTNDQNTNSNLTDNEFLWQPAITAAQTIWAEDATLPIADVIRKIKKMKHLQASAFTESAIRKHIAKLSPTPGKPGRKPAKK